MATLFTTAAVFAAAVLPGASSARQPCVKTFTGPMITRAIDATYRGTRDVSAADRRHLARYIRCARPAVSKTHMRRYLKNTIAAWKSRRDPPMSSAVASYYDLGGSGSCGVEAQAGLRFASLFLPCGAQVRMCHVGCVVATMADHGPYVVGRLFDLNVNLRDAIGCSDLCDVRWRRVG